MNQDFLSEATLNIISTLLVLGAIGVALVFYIAHKMDEADEILSFTPMDTDPVPYEFSPDAAYVRRVLDELGLRKDLAVYRNTQGAVQADVVDQQRGTSDNLRGLLP